MTLTRSNDVNHSFVLHRHVSCCGLEQYVLALRSVFWCEIMDKKDSQNTLKHVLFTPNVILISRNSI